jgi:hypothetical protein
MATPAQIRANQMNSQRSTGPTSAEGKARSSRNSFKHGLYAKDLVLPNEDPAELDQLRASLRAEHQPVNTTEEMLVNDLAENFWRLRRMREFETRAMLPENIADWHQTGLLAVVQRTMAAAERGFHKTLTALRRAQKDRGFVPLTSDDSGEPIGFVPQEPTPETQQIGFVPQEPEPETQQIGFVPEKALNEELAALRQEMRPFLNESGSLTSENARAFAEHMKQKCLAQLNEAPRPLDGRCARPNLDPLPEAA